jgi:hypothetical protein
MKTIILNDDFSNIEEFEKAIEDKGFLDIWHDFQDNGNSGFEYNQLRIWQKIFEQYGLTFDYGLDTETFDFKLKIN